MPFVPNTPESLSALLSRADSNSPFYHMLRRQPASGVVAVFSGQKVFFCEQHKDQSQNVALRHTASFAKRRELLGRGSMDTLIEQVELLVAGEKPGETTTATSRAKKVSPGDYPFIYPPESAGTPRPPTSHRQKKKAQKEQSFWSKLCCCILEDPEEDSYPQLKREESDLRAAAADIVGNDSTEKRWKAHRRGKGDTHVVDSESTPPTPPLPMMYPDPSALFSREQRNTSAAATPGPVAAGGRRNRGNPLIQPTLTEKTAQRIEQELAKPFSEQDEPGYIYVFWLSDSPISPQPTPGSTPSGTPKKSGGRSHQRSASDALRKVVRDAESAQQGQRILLKIGRANNVQRRLHEWSTQCGYNLSLIRFYPHISASSPGSATPKKATTKALNREVGKKVPNSHRIERLIHLELGDNPENHPEIKCDTCKRTHKEWFSVPATRAGLKGVDEVIKKWVEYGEKSAMVTGRDATTQAPRIPKAAPATTGASPPKGHDTPKSTTKRPTLQSAPVGTGAKAAAKKSSSHSRKASSGSAGNTKTDNSSSISAKTTPSRKTPPGKSAGSRTPSRPPSSRGKDSSTPKTTPPPPSGVGSSGRKKRPSGGGGRWKLYDENEGCEEYRPEDEVE
ncbi:DUF1766-domain-containing protein [Tuber magnatum]|uniref:DUF1766-domain-containing protein n=1 Tax=Tuber magnatum TaxID=42249 RepID=A0A317SXA6_9PEZI|nr:DUF1766-domain-containing protein [Tuber magnatum]